MSDRIHSPDRWVVLEMDNNGNKIRKVLGGWSGGYLDGDYWRLSSGTVEIEEDDDYYIFKQHSGSTYKCHKKAEGLTGLMSSVLNNWQSELKEKKKDNISINIIDMEEKE